MAFLSSETLYAKSMQFIHESKQMPLEARREQLIDIALQLTDESLQAQFLNYLDIMSVRPVAQKAVRGCVETIRKASIPMINKLAHGLTEPELDQLVDFSNRLIVGVKGSQGYVGYPVTSAVVENFEKAFVSIRAGNGAAEIERLQEALVEMTRCAYYTFFEEPLALMELGMVKRKLTDVALKVCRSATLTLIGSVFKGMPQQELEAVVDYLESMIYDGSKQ